MIAALAFLLLAAPAQDEISKILERLKTDDAAQRRTALAELHARGEAGVAAAIRALGGPASAPSERITALLKQLASKAWKERDEAMQGLIRLGRPAKPALEALPADADPEVAWRVRSALAEIAERAGREDAIDELRGGALCEFLGEAGDAGAVGPLLGILDAGPADARPELKLRAADALGKLAGRLQPRQAEQTADLVLGMLEKSVSPLQKALLIRVLGRLRAPACVRPLSALLADRSEKNLHLKRACLAALGQTGDAAALRAVIEALRSDDAYVRQAAAAVLEEATGAPPGIDPRATAEENHEAVGRLREWWAKKYSRAWED